MTVHAADTLILDVEGSPSLSEPAARVLARMIRAHRDQATSRHPQDVDDDAQCRSREGH